MLYRDHGAPERIVPELAAPAAPSAGNAVWGSWVQVTASTGYTGILAGLVLSARIVASLTANGTTALQCRLWTAIATGAAASEVEVARTHWGAGALVTLSGLVDDAVTAQSQTPVLVQPKHIAHVLIPSGTRLAARAQNIGLGATLGTRIYTYFYEPDELEASLGEWNIDRLAWLNGVDKTHSMDLPDAAEVTVSSNGTSGGVWQLSAATYAQISASLADDYLIEGINVTHAANMSVQLDVSLGAAASEVVQARAGIPSPGVALPFVVAETCWFPIPFIAWRGERVAVRAANSTTADADVLVRLIGQRLNKD